MINIILADDHLVVRRGIKLLLDSQENIKVIAEADDGRKVLDILSKGTVPDIVITDIAMPEMDGLTLAGVLSKEYPSVKVIFLSMLDKSTDVSTAFDRGARAYLVKNVGYDELLFAIEYVRNGGRYICEELAFMLLDVVREQPERAHNIGEVAKKFDLSERELEVLQLISDGFTNLEIADRLFLSKRTVEGHRQSLIDKTKTKNSASLVKFAVSFGLVS